MQTDLADNIKTLRQKVFANMVSVEEYALALGKCERTVWNYIRLGLPVTYIGTHAYVVLSKATEYWAARTRERLEPRQAGRPRKHARTA